MQPSTVGEKTTQKVTESPIQTNDTEKEQKKNTNDVSTINVVTVFGGRMTSSRVQATISSLITVVVVLGLMVLCLISFWYKKLRLPKGTLGLRAPQVSPH